VAQKDTKKNSTRADPVFLSLKKAIFFTALRPSIIKRTAVNESRKEMENRAPGSYRRIKIPAQARELMASVSLLTAKDVIKTVIMIKARWVDGENPAKKA